MSWQTNSTSAATPSVGFCTALKSDAPAWPIRQTETIRLYHEGWSPPQIGQRMGVDAVTVRRRLREHRISIPNTQEQTRPQAGDDR
jgi:transposase-like protein